MRVRPALVLAFCVILGSSAAGVRAESSAEIVPASGQPLVWLAGVGYCSVLNPSCGRDPWWQQFNELQSDALSHFTLTETPLTVEERYLEAVNLLWTWDEGRTLLRDGSEFGVVIRSGVFDREPSAIASYNSLRRQVHINPTYARAATWMLAAVLSHELQHISDAHARRYQAHETEQCFMRETRAYKVQSRFIRWFTGEVVGERLPTRELSAHSAIEMRVLGDLLVRISSAPNPGDLVRKDYAESCVRTP